MENPKQDIRITKTHQALAKTMMELLETKKFQKITVNDICQNAMVSRSTFYLHFEDKYQLLSFCLQIARQKLKESAQEKDLRGCLHMLLSNVKEQEKLYRNLFMADVNLELIQMFQSELHTVFMEALTEFEQQGAEFQSPLPLLAVYYANGISGMIMWWIENNFQYSVDEMALCQYNLLSEIIPE